MKRIFFKHLSLSLLFLFILSGFAFSQKTFEVQDFSSDYYGKVYLEQPSEVFSKGWIEIHQKKTNKLLIKIESEEIAVDLEKGKVKANVLELPYGEQSVIIYEDFNFDGKKDFAVLDGQNSCYHGPSFQIYLATENKSKFLLSKDFTQLAQEYCGMFEVVPGEKMIKTMTKSGCCWHQYSDFVVQNNKPKPIKIVEEKYEAPFVYLDIKTWQGTKETKTQEKSLANLEELSVLLSFKLDNKKEVFLLNVDNNLSYNLVDEKGRVELSLPVDAKNQNTKFVLDSKQNPQNLIFVNDNFEYKIYENNNEIGVQVNGKGFNKKFVGEYTSKKGSLQALLSENLDNVTSKE